MRILLTNNTLAWRSGSELYARDLAIALRRRGHDPVAFSTLLGDVADDLRAELVPVTDDLRTIGVAPDVIHGQHHLETMAALARFPGVPAIFVCHGFLPWQEAPPRHPRIRRYVAVDDLVRERLVVEGGVAPDDLRVLYNFVDLRRFPVRDALPARPRRALVFNGHATEENFGAIAREACDAAGIELQLVGYGSGRVVSDAGALLRGYDVVFARARSAIEAMASGCAVIVADPHGVAGLVTPSNVDALRKRNFGASTLTKPLTAGEIAGQLARYDAADAARVCEAIRRDAGIDAAVDAYEAMYAEVAGGFREAGDEAERDALVGYLQWLTRQTKLPGLYGWNELRKSHDTLALAVDALRARLSRKDRGQAAGVPGARGDGESSLLSRWMRRRR